MRTRVVLHEYRIITAKKNHNLMLKVRERFGIYGNSSSMNAVKINLLKY